MSRRSTRRALRSDSSSDQSHLDNDAGSTSSRRPEPHSPETETDSDGDNDDYEQAGSRRARDLEQGGGGGRRWAMQSLPPTRRGGAGQDPESLVRASKKTSSSQAQGRYAPIAQGDPAASSRNAGAGTSDYSDLEHSPPYSEDGDGPHSQSPGESDVEKQAPSTRRSGSKKGKRAAAAAASGDDGDEPKGGMTKKRWLLIGGGAVLILVIIIAVIAVYMNSKGDTSSAKSESAEDSSPSSSSKSVGASGSSKGSSASTASASEGTLSGASASGGSSSASGAIGALSSSVQLEPSSAAASAAPSLSGAASLAADDSKNPTSELNSLGTFEAPTAARATATAPAATNPAAAGASRSTEAAGACLDPTASVVPGPAARPSSPPSSPSSGGAANAGWTGSTQTSSSADQDAIAKLSTTATWFAADQHLSACKQTFSDADLVAAVSPDMFGSDGSTVSQLCGAELVVWQPDSNVTIIVKIGDVCNECPTPTAIDLSESAFLALAPGGSDDAAAALDAGVLSVQWWFADSKAQQSLGFGFEEWAAAGASEA
ncbi:hypothetical protein JCM9279_000351 [Rhodotorula babjevae]